MEENVLNIAHKEHPFISDDYTLRDLTVETRKSPSLRIASFIAGFENTENGMAEKIKRLLLCDRDCCKVVSSSGKDSTNKDIIKECLSGNRGIGSRGNAVQLICNMLSDECQEIKDVAKDIVEEVFCEKNINDMVKNKGPVVTYSWLLSTLVLYGEDFYRSILGGNRKREGSKYIHNVLRSVDVLFSDENFGDVPKNRDFISSLPLVLKRMLRYSESEERTTKIMLKLLSEKNTSTVLKNKDFMSDLPEALEEMLRCTNLVEDTAEIIGKLLSKENVNIVLKNESFISHLPNMIYEMLHHEGSKEKAANIIDELFSSQEVINIMLNDECFVSGLPDIVEKMLDSITSRDKLVGIMEKLFSSKENVDSVFKNEEFAKQIPQTLEKMLSNASLVGDVSGIILKLLFAKNTDVVLKDENYMSHLPGMIYEMLRNEGSKENAANIMGKLFFIKENIDIVLKNENFLCQLPDTINLMLDNENLKEKAVNIVNKLVGSDVINEKLKSKLNDLLACEKLLSGKDIETVLKNENFMSRLSDMIYKMLRNKGLEEKAASIMEKIFSTKENIGIVLKNEDFVVQLPDTFKQMLENEDLKKRTANIVNKLLGSDAINAELKSELNDIVREYDQMQKRPPQVRSGMEVCLGSFEDF